MRPLVVSLFDRSGAWPEPWAAGGFRVVTVDLEPALPGTMFAGREHVRADVLSCPVACEADVLLLAPPCTEFAVSGARWFATKDADGRTASAVRVVRSALDAIRSLRPAVWALENPVGRLSRLVPELGSPALAFDPCDYAGHANDPEANAYTKRTQLWGDFCADLEVSRIQPVRACSQGSWLQRLGGRSERTKVLRSTTPQGFARAFYMANRLAQRRARWGWAAV